MRPMGGLGCVNGDEQTWRFTIAISVQLAVRLVGKGAMAARIGIMEIRWLLSPPNRSGIDRLTRLEGARRWPRDGEGEETNAEG